MISWRDHYETVIGVAQGVVDEDINNAVIET